MHTATPEKCPQYFSGMLFDLKRIFRVFGLAGKKSEIQMRLACFIDRLISVHVRTSLRQKRLTSEVNSERVNGPESFGNRKLFPCYATRLKLLTSKDVSTRTINIRKLNLGISIKKFENSRNQIQLQLRFQDLSCSLPIPTFCLAPRERKKRNT